MDAVADDGETLKLFGLSTKCGDLKGATRSHQYYYWLRGPMAKKSTTNFIFDLIFCKDVYFVQM